jgi:hypothetical protein
MSVYLLTFAAMPLAAVPMAWLADQVGGPATIAAAGLVVVVTMVAVALGFPAYRTIK